MGRKAFTAASPIRPPATIYRNADPVIHSMPNTLRAHAHTTPEDALAHTESPLQAAQFHGLRSRARASPKLAIIVDREIHGKSLAAAARNAVSYSAWKTEAAREALRRWHFGKRSTGASPRKKWST